MIKINGFVYGHFDSRGGTTFIEATTKEEADERYLKEVALLEDNDLQDQNMRNTWLSDYMGQAELHSPRHPTQPGDLEAGDGAVLAFGNKPAPDADGWDEDYRSGEQVWSFICDWFKPDQVATLVYSPDGKPVPGYQDAFRVRWEDDAFSFIFMPAANLTQ